MATKKVWELTALANVSSDDLLVVANDPGGTPTLRKIPVSDVLGALPNSLISDTDNADDLGSPSKKWRTGFYGTSVNIGGMYIQPSATTGSTLAILAGDFATPRSLLANSFRITTDDSANSADVGFGRIDAGVATIFNPTGGSAVLELAQVASLGTVSSNSGRIGVKDVSGTGEWFVKDEAGNETQISPHNKKGEWVFYSVNERTGKGVEINMEQLVKEVERLSKKKFTRRWRVR